MFRRQLPAYSPLTFTGLALGARGVHGRPDERLATFLAGRYRAHRVVLTGSGTQALTLALRASPRGDRAPVVALPAYACYDVVSAAVGADARILFYDIDPLTLAPDLESLSEICGLKPDAVVVAPLYGIPVDMDRVRAKTDACGALLIEDAAQGMGATWRGRSLGTWGDASVLSFGRGKGWTGGTGGALLERVPEERAGLPKSPAVPDLSVGIRAGAQWLLGRPLMYWLPAALPWLALGETEYHAPVEPRSMPPLAASLVLAHEREAVRESEVRKRNARDLLNRLAPLTASGTLVPIRGPDEGEPGYLRLPLLVPGGMTAFRNPEAARVRGIMPGYPRPLPELPAARERTLAGPPTPGAERLVADLITLPTHRMVTIADKKRAVGAHSLSRVSNRS